MRKRNPYKIFFSVSIITWLVGCLPMLLLYEVFGGKEYASSIPECKGYFDFLAVRWGDMFFLPLLNAGLFVSSDFEKVKSSVYRKTCVVAAIIAFVFGLVIQLSWVFPLRTTEGLLPGNWTFYKSSIGIVFNRAGYYHAFFFVAELSFLGFTVTRDWLSGILCSRKKISNISRGIALVAGTVFLCLHNLDDYSEYGSGRVVVFTVVISCILSIIYIYSQIAVRNILNRKVERENGNY